MRYGYPATTDDPLGLVGDDNVIRMVSVGVYCGAKGYVPDLDWGASGSF